MPLKTAKKIEINWNQTDIPYYWALESYCLVVSQVNHCIVPYICIKNMIYNIAHVLALYKTILLSRYEQNLYLRFFHDDVFSCDFRLLS